MVVQWFPGHMSKALRQMKEKLNLIEVVFELVDARLPISSSNPFVSEMIEGKPRVILLNKMDKADPKKTKEWIEHFRSLGHEAVAVNSINGDGFTKIIPAAKEVLKEKLEKDKQKGLKERSIRALIVGIPNVGKSTLINKLAKRKATAIGDRPGITKVQQWIKVGKELELLDTPGVLWNKFEDQEVGYRLAITGAIKDEILPIDDVVIYGIKFLAEHHPRRLMERYKTEDLDPIALMDHIGKIRGARRGGETDYDRVFGIILNDIRNGNLGRITFDV